MLSKRQIYLVLNKCESLTGFIQKRRQQRADIIRQNGF
ncbi:hypothetical protein GPAL_3776 [Glaciecola pallidula DSM 14239 = ACAM 615]|uniref:Uncharacterized protein n=1 Tax=Brumicola pallidula DSM 14239 = ACAM 615 TaxID=1121922 RepID=K6Z2Z8_9ALTE|nr:hypothetical protein GPAL_3776 [Glaciecola pallidula DSM 14239 = ACAM 615]